MENENIIDIKENLLAGFYEPNTREQVYACINAIKSFYELQGTNKSEFTIHLRDYLLDNLY